MKQAEDNSTRELPGLPDPITQEKLNIDEQEFYANVCEEVNVIAKASVCAAISFDQALAVAKLLALREIEGRLFGVEARLYHLYEVLGGEEAE